MSPSEEDERVIKNVKSAMGILAYGLRDAPYCAPELRSYESLGRLAMEIHNQLDIYVKRRFPEPAGEVVYATDDDAF